jgi:hypothetical protein
MLGKEGAAPISRIPGHSTLEPLICRMVCAQVDAKIRMCGQITPKKNIRTFCEFKASPTRYHAILHRRRKIADANAIGDKAGNRHDERWWSYEEAAVLVLHQSRMRQNTGKKLSLADEALEKAFVHENQSLYLTVILKGAKRSEKSSFLLRGADRQNKKRRPIESRLFY